METQELKELNKIIIRINCTEKRIDQLKKQGNTEMGIKSEQATLRYLYKALEELEESI